MFRLNRNMHKNVGKAKVSMAGFIDLKHEIEQFIIIFKIHFAGEILNKGVFITCFVLQVLVPHDLQPMKTFNFYYVFLYWKFLLGLQ